MAEYASAIATVVAVAGAAVSTYAAVKQSEQTAALSESIRKQKLQEAQQASETAAFEETQHRRKIALLMGKEEAILAAAGVATTSGTPLIQEIDLARQGELEALSIRRGGQIQAGGASFEAGIAKYRRDVSRGAVPLQIVGGALSAASAGFTTSYLTRPRSRAVTSTWGAVYEP
jgi:hypothetical protein